MITRLDKIRKLLVRCFKELLCAAHVTNGRRRIAVTMLILDETQILPTDRAVNAVKMLIFTSNAVCSEMRMDCEDTDVDWIAQVNEETFFNKGNYFLQFFSVTCGTKPLN